MLESVIDAYGEAAVLMAAGGLVGVIFGAAAQHSRFCLRAATVEVVERSAGPRLSVWLMAFCAAAFLIQAAIVADVLDVGEARQLATTGSLSGAIIAGG